MDIEYQCQPTSPIVSLIICDEDSETLACSKLEDRLLIFEGMFKTTLHGYCPVRLKPSFDTMEKDTEVLVEMRRKCNRTPVTPALMQLCQGKKSCIVRADPKLFNVATCEKINVFLNITFTCMNQVRIVVVSKLVINTEQTLHQNINVNMM